MMFEDHTALLLLRQHEQVPLDCGRAGSVPHGSALKPPRFGRIWAFAAGTFSALITPGRAAHKTF